MTSALAQLTSTITKNDVDLAGPLLQALNIAMNARGDPALEADVRGVMQSLYSKTSHCQNAMEQFMSLETPLAA